MSLVPLVVCVIVFTLINIIATAYLLANLCRKRLPGDSVRRFPDNSVNTHGRATDLIISHLVDFCGFGLYQVTILCICAGGYFAICTDLLVLVYIRSSLEDSLSMGDLDFAFLSFASSLSSNVGSLAFGLVADHWGSRKPFILSSFLTVASCLAGAVTQEFYQLLLTRTIVGMGLGGLTSVDFVVFNEICPTKDRGKATITITLCGAFGVLFIAGINLCDLDTLVPTEQSWRLMTLIAAAPMIPVYILRLFFSDESLRYLAKTGNYRETHTVIRKIARMNGISDDELRTNEHFIQLQALCEEVGQPESEDEQKYVSSFSLKVMVRLYQHVITYDVRLTLLLLGVWTCQGVSYWGLTLFLPEYLSNKGDLPVDWTMFLMVACEVPGLLLIYLLVDKPQLGRLKLMRLMFFMSCALSFMMAFSKDKYIIIACCCAIYFYLIPNWGLLFTYSAEIYPTGMRATAMGFFQVASSISSLFSPFLSGKLADEQSSSDDSSVDWYMVTWGISQFLGLICAVLLKKDTALVLSIS